jgi:cellulose synthase/poly-beta-1,6-N-acetylglucosamine synthase-like glycosyltransferase
MTDAARVDVVISALNEEGDVGAAIDAALAQTVPVRNLVFVDGGSRDRTVEVVNGRAERDPRIRVIADGVRRSLPGALNLALANCEAPFVAKVDARTFVAPDFLERALAVFDETNADDIGCAGGQPEQFGRTAFGEALAAARTSPFGVGASGYADRRTRAEVDTVQCGVYRRRALEEVGLFDEALQFGEDEELNWRLRCAGWRIVRDAGIRFRYVTRSSWSGAFRQYRNYGRARVAVAAKHRGFLRPYHLVPSAALAGGALLAALTPFSRRARLAVAAGAALYAGAASFAAGRAPEAPRLQTVAAFAALHAGYGLGVVEALATRGLRRAPKEA